MHIKPIHKKKSVQQFILGLLTGMCIAYILFTYMYGKMYEDVLVDKMILQTKVSELERQKEVLLHDKEHLEEVAIPSIEAIEINFLNSEQLLLDRLITHQFEIMIKDELNDIIGKPIDSLANNDELLIRLIENKQYTIDSLTYEFEIRKLSISQKIKLTLYVKLMK